jgi:hypothetical protein
VFGRQGDGALEESLLLRQLGCTRQQNAEIRPRRLRSWIEAHSFSQFFFSLVSNTTLIEDHSEERVCFCVSRLMSNDTTHSNFGFFQFPGLE